MIRRALLAWLLALALGAAAGAAGAAEAPAGQDLVERVISGEVVSVGDGVAWVSISFTSGLRPGMAVEFLRGGSPVGTGKAKAPQFERFVVEVAPPAKLKVGDAVRVKLLEPRPPGYVPKVEKPPEATLRGPDGELLYPRSQAEISAALAKLRPAEAGGALYAETPSAAGELKAGKLSPGALSAALAHLKAYRYLAGVPYEDVALKDQYNSESQHAAVLLAILKRLDHTPKRPEGVPEDFFKVAYQGTSHSNLAQGPKGLSLAVDMWMFDSDPSNIDRLGHRRWCINPTMLNTGFGTFGGFSAIWALDTARKPAPDFDYIPYPVRGYHPVGYFGPAWAWCVSLNPARYAKPDRAAVKAAIYPLDSQLKRAEKPLELNYENINTTGFGVPICIIFRPKAATVSPGSRYQVEIEGLKRKNGSEAKIQYLVEFCP